MNTPSANSTAAAFPVSPETVRSGEADQREQTRWFREEVQQHESALRAWLYNRFPALKDIDDVVQESYLRIMRARTGGKIACPRTYLFGIARHVAVESFRSSSRFPETPVNDLDELPTTDSKSDVVETVNHKQEVALAIEAIDSLPDRCREIVLLRANEGLSYQEIATRLGVAEETVRVQVARGIKRCALYVREHGANAP